jgi:hypothetical protein
VIYGGGSDGSMLKYLGRNELLPEQNVTQLLLSVFDEDQMWYPGASKNVDLGSTSHAQINICHPFSTTCTRSFEALPNLSPLGRETTGCLFVLATVCGSLLSKLHHILFIISVTNITLP